MMDACNMKVVSREEGLWPDDALPEFQNLTKPHGNQDWQDWNELNCEAIDSYNERIEREGLPFERYKTF